MSLRGVKQLKELVIRYSDIDGSSRGARSWIQQNVVGFAQANPSIVIKAEKKRNCHPLVKGYYVNGNSKTICVKNLEPEEVYDYILDLRNQIGRKTSSNGYSKPVLSNRPSIQGEWHERMDLIDIPMTVETKIYEN